MSVFRVPAPAALTRGVAPWARERSWWLFAGARGSAVVSLGEAHAARRCGGRSRQQGGCSAFAICRLMLSFLCVLEITKLEMVLMFPLACPCLAQPCCSSQIHLCCCYLQLQPSSTSKASPPFPLKSLLASYLCGDSRSPPTFIKQT